MNSHALQQMFHSSKQMLEQAAHSLVEVKQYIEGAIVTLAASTEEETDEERKRRRKLKAIRWTIALTIACLGYKLVKYVVMRRRRRKGLLSLGYDAGGFNNMSSSSYNNTNILDTSNYSGMGYGDSRYHNNNAVSPYQNGNTWNNNNGLYNSNYSYGHYNNTNPAFGSSPTYHGGNTFYDHPGQGRW